LPTTFQFSFVFHNFLFLIKCICFHNNYTWIFPSTFFPWSTFYLYIRDRPFNLKGGYGFLFRSEFFFRTTQELEYLFFLLRKVRNFFPEFNIRLYDKNSESDYFFFPPPKS
jgi:hypothetical protein